MKTKFKFTIPDFIELLLYFWMIGTIFFVCGITGTPVVLFSVFCFSKIVFNIFSR